MNNHGQCNNLAVENGTVCLCHGGNVQLKVQADKSKRNYRLTQFQARLERHTDSTHIKSLREEIGILRMLLEERLNKCQSTTDLMLQSASISDLVLKLDKVVTSCHKLEGSMGQLLDKQIILQFGSEVVGIIGDEISDETTLDRVSSKIMEAITKCTNSKESSESV